MNNAIVRFTPALVQKAGVMPFLSLYILRPAQQHKFCRRAVPAVMAQIEFVIRIHAFDERRDAPQIVVAVIYADGKLRVILRNDASSGWVNPRAFSQ